MKTKAWKRKHWMTIILSAIYAVCAACLCVFSYVTYAWFSTTRTAEVNFASLKVDEGISYRLKAFTGNGSIGYERSQASTYTSASTFSYTLGPTTTASYVDVSASETSTSYAPGYAASYSIEITNEGDGPKTIALNLTHFASLASTACYSDAAYSQGISLSQAMRVYASFPTNTADGDLKKDAEDFMIDSNPTNYFVPANATTDGDGKGGYSYSDPEAWGGSSGISLAGGATGVLFISFYFSNENSTFYSYVSTDESDTTKSYYKASTAGDSNVYKGLNIAFSRLDISIINY
jgi:hypothetical protein